MACPLPGHWALGEPVPGGWKPGAYPSICLRQHLCPSRWSDGIREPDKSPRPSSPPPPVTTISPSVGPLSLQCLYLLSTDLGGKSLGLAKSIKGPLWVDVAWAQPPPSLWQAPGPQSRPAKPSDQSGVIRVQMASSSSCLC